MYYIIYVLLEEFFEYFKLIKNRYMRALKVYNLY